MWNFASRYAATAVVPAATAAVGASQIVNAREHRLRGRSIPKAMIDFLSQSAF